jgi:hypothetical protein
MDTKEQLSKARQLIQARRYDEARTLLKRIDHPKAKEWLAKLPPPKRSPAKKKSSGGGMRFYLLILLVIVLVGAGVLFALNQSNSDEEETGGDPAAASEPEPTTEPTAPPAPDVSLDDMQPNSAEISNTGAYNAAGEPDLSFVPEPTGLFAPRQIAIHLDVESSDGEEPPGRLDLLISVPDDSAGTYPLVDVLREMSDSWGVIHTIFGRESWISPEDMDTITIEGTITVVENGDSFSGAFEFTTSSTVDDRSMTVSGRINQIPFAGAG